MKLVMSIMLFFSGLNPTEAHASFIQQGKASFYAKKFTGRRTANGERVNPNAFEAAHRTLPFNTLVEVTNLHNNRSIIVRINDRGPFSRGRVLDMTYAAAKELGFIGRGVAKISLRVVGKGKRVATNAEANVPIDYQPLMQPVL
jgi:rare lipoprotein A